MSEKYFFRYSCSSIWTYNSIEVDVRLAFYEKSRSAKSRVFARQLVSALVPVAYCSFGGKNGRSFISYFALF